MLTYLNPSKQTKVEAHVQSEWQITRHCAIKQKLEQICYAHAYGAQSEEYPFERSNYWRTRQDQREIKTAETNKSSKAIIIKITVTKKMKVFSNICTMSMFIVRFFCHVNIWRVRLITASTEQSCPFAFSVEPATSPATPIWKLLSAPSRLMKEMFCTCVPRSKWLTLKEHYSNYHIGLHSWGVWPRQKGCSELCEQNGHLPKRP